MSPAEIVTARLLQIAAVTDIVTSRVYVLKLPENLSDWPAIRAQGIGLLIPSHLRGTGAIQTARVQVDFFDREQSGHDPYAGVRALARASRGAFVDGRATGLQGWQGTAGSAHVRSLLCDGEQEMYDPDELRLVRISHDYILTFTE